MTEAEWERGVRVRNDCIPPGHVDWIKLSNDSLAEHESVTEDVVERVV